MDIGHQEEDYYEGYYAHQQGPCHWGSATCIDLCEVVEWNAGGQEGYCEEE